MKAMAPKKVLVLLLTVVSISSIIASDSERVQDNSRLAPADGYQEDFGMRIVGGEPAAIGDYPYFVQMDGCGGTLVAPDVVLFAAHCGSSYRNQQVNVGAYKSWDTLGGAQGRFCQQWMGHPQYTDAPVPNYDFALCKLDRPIESFNKGKVRLELNFDDNLPSHGDDLLTMGFGLLTSGGSMPEYLRNVTVDSISNYDCNNAYGGLIKDAMLCAGIQNQGGKDACQGDSGGPMVQRRVHSDGSIVDTHVGIVSWGIGCGSARYPGVYARTSHEANWIQNTICGPLQSVASYCHNPAPTCGDQGDVTIRVETDQYPEETSWTIRDANNRIVQERKHFKMKDYPTESNLCLDANACYSFEIKDTFGDGVCSSPYSCGSYSIMLNGKSIVTGNPSFGTIQTHVICVNAPPVQEEAKTTEAPTANPTEAPTNVPTNNPTRAPTSDVCQDNASFRFRNKPNMNCKNWIKGRRKTIVKRCRKKWKQYSVKHYWCRKRCAEMLGRTAQCFSLRDKKVRRKKKTRNEKSIVEENDSSEKTQRTNEESTVEENDSRDNIFKRSKKSKTK